jgi:hypothetical protein
MIEVNAWEYAEQNYPIKFLCGAETCIVYNKICGGNLER